MNDPQNDAKILSPTTDNIARAADVLLAGRLIGLPTETVYGLAARGDDASAVHRIFAAKNRPRHNPLILHVSCFEHARSLFATDLGSLVTQRAERLGVFWPGPLTLIGPRHETILDCVTAGGETVAVRVPDHPVALAVLRVLAEKAGRVIPVAAPSANVSNYVSPTTAKHVADGVGREVAWILDGGPCRVGLESTIVFLGTESSPVRILRSGQLSAGDLSSVLGELIAEPLAQPLVPTTTGHPSSQGTKSVFDDVAAPGQFPKHYSPRTPLVLIDVDRTCVDARSTNLRERVLRIVMTPIESTGDSNGQDVWTLAADGRLETAASNLYAILRRADNGDYDRIEVESCVHSGIGIAILDRLRRASSR